MSSRMQVLLSIGVVVLLGLVMNIVFVGGLLKVDKEYSAVIEKGIGLMDESATLILDAVNRMQEDISDVSAVTEELSVSAEEVAASPTTIAEAVEEESQSVNEVSMGIDAVGAVFKTLGEKSKALKKVNTAQQQLAAQFKV